MHVDELGRGDRAVLILHGSPSALSDLVPVAERLAVAHRVLFPHLPGYGASPPCADITYDAVAGQLVEVVRSRGIEKLVAIVGYSSGSYRALDLALRHGVAAERIIGLAALGWVDDELRAALRGAAAALRAEPTGASIRAILPERWLSPAWRAAHPEDDVRVASWLDAAHASTLVAELESQAEVTDLRPLLPRLAARLHLRVGAQDVACPPSWSEQIAALAPDAHLTVVPDVGHALLVEDAEATIEWIYAAINS